MIWESAEKWRPFDTRWGRVWKIESLGDFARYFIVPTRFQQGVSPAKFPI